MFKDADNWKLFDGIAAYIYGKYKSWPLSLNFKVMPPTWYKNV